MKKVLLLRRDPESLKPEEKEAIIAAFGGNEVEFKRIDPSTYIDHAEICRAEKPDAVMLPLEKPIPSQAMDEGFAHIICTPGGVKQLEPLVPKFSDFKPN